MLKKTPVAKTGNLEKQLHYSKMEQTKKWKLIFRHKNKTTSPIDLYFLAWSYSYQSIATNTIHKLFENGHWKKLLSLPFVMCCVILYLKGLICHIGH